MNWTLTTNFLDSNEALWRQRHWPLHPLSLLKSVMPMVHLNIDVIIWACIDLNYKNLIEYII